MNIVFTLLIFGLYISFVHSCERLNCYYCKEKIESLHISNYSNTRCMSMDSLKKTQKRNGNSNKCFMKVQFIIRPKNQDKSLLTYDNFSIERGSGYSSKFLHVVIINGSVNIDIMCDKENCNNMDFQEFITLHEHRYMPLCYKCSIRRSKHIVDSDCANAIVSSENNEHISLTFCYGFCFSVVTYIREGKYVSLKGLDRGCLSKDYIMKETQLINMEKKAKCGKIGIHFKDFGHGMQMWSICRAINGVNKNNFRYSYDNMKISKRIGVQLRNEIYNKALSSCLQCQHDSEIGINERCSSGKYLKYLELTSCPENCYTIYRIKHKREYVSRGCTIQINNSLSMMEEILLEKDYVIYSLYNDNAQDNIYTQNEYRLKNNNDYISIHICDPFKTKSCNNMNFGYYKNANNSGFFNDNISNDTKKEKSKNASDTFAKKKYEWKDRKINAYENNFQDSEIDYISTDSDMYMISGQYEGTRKKEKEADIGVNFLIGLPVIILVMGICIYTYSIKNKTKLNNAKRFKSHADANTTMSYLRGDTSFADRQSLDDYNSAVVYKNNVSDTSINSNSNKYNYDKKTHIILDRPALDYSAKNNTFGLKQDRNSYARENDEINIQNQSPYKSRYNEAEDYRINDDVNRSGRSRYDAKQNKLSREVGDYNNQGSAITYGIRSNAFDLNQNIGLDPRYDDQNKSRFSRLDGSQIHMPKARDDYVNSGRDSFIRSSLHRFDQNPPKMQIDRNEYNDHVRDSLNLSSSSRFYGSQLGLPKAREDYANQRNDSLNKSRTFGLDGSQLRLARAREDYYNRGKNSLNRSGTSRYDGSQLVLPRAREDYTNNTIDSLSRTISSRYDGSQSQLAKVPKKEYITQNIMREARNYNLPKSQRRPYHYENN